MSASLQTLHGMGYVANADVTSWLNVFNPLVLRLEVLLTQMDATDVDNRADLQALIDAINIQITSINSSNSVQDSNILALQTALTNVNTTLGTINDNYAWTDSTITIINSTGDIACTNNKTICKINGNITKTVTGWTVIGVLPSSMNIKDNPTHFWRFTTVKDDTELASVGSINVVNREIMLYNKTVGTFYFDVTIPLI